jgi:septal ring factor EnvC (AmiA/AmiB activator)
MVIALALLALALPIVILAAWHLERQERNDQIRAERAARAHEMQAWQDERRELLNRIKPETAQYQAPADARPAPRIPFDDDEAFHKVVNPLETSKEDLAEMDAFLDARAHELASQTASGGPEA